MGAIKKFGGFAIKVTSGKLPLIAVIFRNVVAQFAQDKKFYLVKMI